MDAPGDTPDREPDDRRERDEPDRYETVDPGEVAEDAIEFLGEGTDDPRPVAPPPAPDEQPPPNA